MLKIKVSSLKPGLKLGKDVYTSDNQLLLPKGTIITEEQLSVFNRRNLKEIFIMETSPRLKSETQFADVYTGSLGAVKAFMLEAKLGKNLEIEEIGSTVDMLLQQVFDAIDLFKQMRIMKAKDDYLFTHSVNVSLLCILIGRWLKCEEKVVTNLGIAGLLHDIGKVFIPDEILNKPDKLTDSEFAEIKKHPLLGYNLVAQHEDISADIANAVLMHHERLDGSGYPIGKGQMGFLASVVAVADVYDAITSSRTYSSKQSPYTAAEILWSESFGKLDPRITKVFYDKITNFYIGNEVLLSNNQKGVVVYINPTQPTRPIVMAGDVFYDLSTDRNLTIIEIID
jgi:HD-GYP domain-containing protein (c-di-GMP phosphodiesterase class II)